MMLCLSTITIIFSKERTTMEKEMPEIKIDIDRYRAWCGA